MTKITIPQIFEKYGSKVVLAHMERVEKKEASIRQMQYDLEKKVLYTLTNKVQKHTKKPLKKSLFGRLKKNEVDEKQNIEEKAYLFLSEVLPQEIHALYPWDYITLAINKRKPVQKYENDSKKIFDLKKVLSGPFGSSMKLDDFIAKMKKLLEKQKGYLSEREVRFRLPRVKKSYEVKGSAVNVFYTCVKRKNKAENELHYFPLFDLKDTVNYLEAQGYQTKTFDLGGKESLKNG